MFLGCMLRVPEDGGECIYNCAPNDGMFCRVEFERLITGSLGNLKGLCFKNKACFGTPKACIDCNLKCQDYIGCFPTPTSAPFEEARKDKRVKPKQCRLLLSIQYGGRGPK